MSSRQGIIKMSKKKYENKYDKNLQQKKCILLKFLSLHFSKNFNKISQHLLIQNKFTGRFKEETIKIFGWSDLCRKKYKIP